MMQLLRSREFTLMASAAIVALVTAFAYSQLGFLGMVLVGLLILFMAVQSELQKDGLSRPSIVERTNRIEQMARMTESDDMVRFWRWAGILGAVLTTLGLAGFVLLQLPH